MPILLIYIFSCLQHAHPYISAMVNNGTLFYDHDRDGTHTQLAGCEARFRNVEHETYIAIRYENDKLSGNIFNFILNLKKFPHLFFII